MPRDQYFPSPIRRHLGAFWATARHAWRYANIASHHILGGLFKLLVLAYFLFAALILVLRYAVLPNIDVYKPAIEQMASRALGRQVAAGSLQASWRGLRPHLSMTDVVVRDPAGQPALVLPRVSATLAWSSVLVADLRLQRLEIDQPDLAIRRDSDGLLHVGGILVDLNQEGDGKGMDWVLAQEEIVIRGGRLSWLDEKRGAPELALQGVDFVMRNHWRRHRFALRATPPPAYAQPLDVRADFQHPHFAKRISDVRRWTGDLYVDVRETDLTVWKAYVNYPVELTQGRGSVRAWLAFDQARVADFSADLSLANVHTRLRHDLQPLDLAQVDGRISVSEEIDPQRQDGTPTFGAHGHAIALANFSFRTREGLVFPSTTLSERYTPARNGQPEKFEVTAKLLDLHTVANFAEKLPLPAGQREMLADFLPRGQLKDFSVQWQGSYPALAAYRVKGHFAGLSMQPQAPRPARPKTATQPAQAALPAIPGFANLSGAVDASDKGGSFQVLSNGLELNLPGYFSEPVMAFEKLDMQASWTFQKDEQLLLEIDRMDFVQDGLVASLSGRHLMPLQARQGAPLGQIDLSGKIAELDLAKVGRYLPLQTPPETRAWLAGGLESGKAHNLALRIKGNLADFPFRAERPGVKPAGEFTLSGRIADGRLNYTPGVFAADGKTPLWPLLHDIQGTIAFNRARLEINANSGKTGGATVSNVKAVIPDLLSDHPLLDIDGQAEAALQDFIAYVNTSPVAEWIGHFTEDSKASGKAKLALKLQLPLNDVEKATVQGALQFLGNDIGLFNGLPTLSATSGKLEFSERGLSLPSIKAGFLGGATTITGSTLRDGSIVIKSAGNLTADGLRKAYAAPAMQRIGQRISGGTRYAAQIRVKAGGQTDVTVESSLQGIGLDLPVPLKKAARDTLPFKLELTSKGDATADSLRDEIRLSAGTAIAAWYEREKPRANHASWRVLRGGIGINVPAPQPDSGVIVNVSLPSLNIDAWSQLVSSILDGGKAPLPAGVAGNGASAAATLDLSPYLEPEVLAARATELIVAGKKLDNVVVGASHLPGAWQANIDSDQASGYVTWHESPSGRGLGKVTARLASLVVPKSAASDVSELLEGKQETSSIPALDITAENFELFGKRFGQLELQANNMRPSGGMREWRINKLAIANPDGELQAKGKWLSRDGVSQSSLDYTLDIVDAGKLLDRFGFSNVLRGGKGKMQGELRWKGLPFALDIPSLDGQLSLDVGAGQFLKVDPSAAKLLGVLSLQSLPRRLALDFRDVFSEGFAFDGIVGSAAIAHGVATTDNFKMRGVSATVLMGGTADIAKETTNLHVAIIPDINAGAASLVYGLAVNPVIGLGTFLAQLFLRDPLMKAFTFEYQITGPWKDPVVTKLGRKSDAAAGQSGAAGARANSETVN
ncbi:YhdP family protein [Noviherbaspirillum sedimenti]|uniref:TIGR02099 family protein n=1 Tax=Noviherbaspirillum sedimenti TaxID=2320865 RepID=A0A3A3GHM6_9BURK|nr:YhdP family protein [Noviherbaspirillum sedimenti]RJG01766.1 TIGR02099 family protein [Noviherbaspirillum sedimenti]